MSNPVHTSETRMCGDIVPIPPAGNVVVVCYPWASSPSSSMPTVTHSAVFQTVQSLAKNYCQLKTACCLPYRNYSLKLIKLCKSSNSRYFTFVFAEKRIKEADLSDLSDIAGAIMFCAIKIG